MSTIEAVTIRTTHERAAKNINLSPNGRLQQLADLLGHSVRVSRCRTRVTCRDCRAVGIVDGGNLSPESAKFLNWCSSVDQDQLTYGQKIWLDDLKSKHANGKIVL